MIWKHLIWDIEFARCLTTLELVWLVCRSLEKLRVTRPNEWLGLGWLTSTWRKCYIRSLTLVLIDIWWPLRCIVVCIPLLVELCWRCERTRLILLNVLYAVGVSFKLVKIVRQMFCKRPWVFVLCIVFCQVVYSPKRFFSFSNQVRFLLVRST